MIRIRELDHIVLGVNDPQAMIDFYCEVLGCRLEKCKEAPGRIQLRAGNSLVGLVPVDNGPGRADAATPEGRRIGSHRFCFRVDPFDAAEIAAHLYRYDIEASELSLRYGAEGIGPSIYITDPEGNTVELKGPPDPSMTA